MCRSRQGSLPLTERSRTPQGSITGFYIVDRKSDRKVDRESVHDIKPQHTRKPRYSRIPDAVLLDTELSASARCVFAYLARSVFQGATVIVGQRKIAKHLGFARSTVVAAIAELVSQKHIKAKGDGQRRRLYILLSPVFSQKQGKVNEVVSGPNGYRRVSVERKAG